MLGLICNPAAGKDVRRLVATTPVVTNEAKAGLLARVLVGARAAGETRALYLPDPWGLVERAAELAGVDIRLEAVAHPATGTWADTVAAAAAFRDAGVGVVVTLGGDGTNRAVALAWPNALLLPIGAGTNNALPLVVDGTAAGLAAGALATGRIGRPEAARQRPLVRVVVAGQDADDLAVVDAVLLRPGPVGARALYEPTALRLAVVAGPDPTATGLAGIAGLCCPQARRDDAVLLRFDGDSPVLRRVVALAPGLTAVVGLAEARVLTPGERVSGAGPGLLAFDGERERAVPSGATVSFTVDPDGPWIVELDRALRAAVVAGVLDPDPALPARRRTSSS